RIMRSISKGISIVVLSLAASCALRTSGSPTPAQVAARLDGLAVPFVENTGQTDPRVAYYAPTLSGTVFGTGEGELVYALPARERASGWTLTESFVDGRPKPVGRRSTATRISVFAGNDPARWQRDIPTHAGVELGTVWPGISVALTAHGKQV